MGNWQKVVLALALSAVTLGVAAAAPSGDALAKLQRAGRLSEMADTSAGMGDRITAIGFNRKALNLIDEAVALGASRTEVERGRRVIQLDTGDWLLAEQK